MTNKPPKNRKLDWYKITARFGCGFVFGLFASVSVGFVFGAQTMAGLFWGWVLLSMIFGLLSVVFGENFWTKIIQWF